MSRSMIRSFNAYAIGLAAVVLLLSIPSTARAGYPDGMNRYAAYHVMHGGVDPSGTTINPKDAITGSYQKFMSGSRDSDRFIYTCRCGWLDRTHLGAGKDYPGLVRWLTRLSTDTDFPVDATRLSYVGPLATTTTTFVMRNTGRIGGTQNGRQISLQGEGIHYTALGMIYTSWRTGELPQLNFRDRSRGGQLLLNVFPQADTVFSLEDLPTNWVGLHLIALYGNSPAANANNRVLWDASGASYLKQICGEALSEKDAKCLHDEMTEAEHRQKNYTVGPVPFTSKPSCKPTCAGATPSDIFAEAAKAIIYYRTFRAATQARYDSDGGVPYADQPRTPVLEP